ncbi:MAG: alpha/beta hydrolase [Chloroflexota bacterium]
MAFIAPASDHLYFSTDGYRKVQRHYSDMLSAYRVPTTSFYVPTRFGNTFLTVSGPATAPPVLLVHGLANPSPMWRPNIEALSQSFQVYAVDVIGDAGRSSPERPSMLDNSYAMWMIDVLNELALPQVQLIGMSMGGWVSLSTALYHPQRVSGVFLIAPAGIVTLNTSLITQAMFALTQWGGRFNVPSLLAKLAYKADGDIQQLIYLVAQHHRAKPVPPVPILADNELRSIEVPVHIIAGTEDEMFNTRRMLQRARLMPGFATGTLVPGAGHALNATHVHQVNQAILSFFCR